MLLKKLKNAWSAMSTESLSHWFEAKSLRVKPSHTRSYVWPIQHVAHTNWVFDSRANRLTRSVWVKFSNYGAIYINKIHLLFDSLSLKNSTIKRVWLGAIMGWVINRYNCYLTASGPQFLSHFVLFLLYFVCRAHGYVLSVNNWAEKLIKRRKSQKR